MKKKRMIAFFIIGLVLTVSACTSNRLTKSIVTTESANIDDATITAPVPDGRNLQPQLGNANIDLDEVVALLPPDAIPAIFPDEVQKIMVSAAEADAAGMRPTERVLGLSINGESRAYPIPFMSRHEIVNDVVGGKLVAATW